MILSKISRTIAACLWLASTLMVCAGWIKLILWGLRGDISPFGWMEYPERDAIAISFAGIVSVFSARLIPAAWFGQRIVSISRWIVLSAGVCFLLAKGPVLLFSADSQIAQLHRMTFWAAGLMTLSACWPMSEIKLDKAAYRDQNPC